MLLLFVTARIKCLLLRAHSKNLYFFFLLLNLKYIKWAWFSEIPRAAFLFFAFITLGHGDSQVTFVSWVHSMFLFEIF